MLKKNMFSVILFFFLGMIVAGCAVSQDKETISSRDFGSDEGVFSTDENVGGSNGNNNSGGTVDPIVPIKNITMEPFAVYFTDPKNTGGATGLTNYGYNKPVYLYTTRNNRFQRYYFNWDDTTPGADIFQKSTETQYQVMFNYRDSNDKLVFALLVIELKNPLNGSTYIARENINNVEVTFNETGSVEVFRLKGEVRPANNL